ncbi:unnamed protein product [Cunninghamella echinulata]
MSANEFLVTPLPSTNDDSTNDNGDEDGTTTTNDDEANDIENAIKHTLAFSNTLPYVAMQSTTMSLNYIVEIFEIECSSKEISSVFTRQSGVVYNEEDSGEDYGQDQDNRGTHEDNINNNYISF